MNPLSHNFSQTGYIALLSAIILSFVLLLVTVSLSGVSFVTRAQTVLQEQKQTSWYLAQACIQNVIIAIAENTAYNPRDLVTSVGSQSCTINMVAVNNPTVGKYTVQVSAYDGHVASHITAVINGTTLGIISEPEY